MSEVKRIKRSEAQWREIFSRHETSGLPVSTFCAQEGIHPGVFRRWRAGLSGEKKPPGAQRSDAESKVPFIELGELGSSENRFQVRLELGGGMVLSIGRG